MYDQIKMDGEPCPFCKRQLPPDPPHVLERHEVPELIAKVRGVWVGPAHQHVLQCEVAGGLDRNDPRKFPGAQPVSFSARHFEELKNQDYYVCEKTDGLRVLMYMSHYQMPIENPHPGQPTHYKLPVCYLIDRRNNYYAIADLKFPHHEDPTFEKFHEATVLDGELVEDRYPNGRTLIKFLAFDLLVIDEKNLTSRPLDKRLAYLKDHILRPYRKWIASDNAIRNNQPFLFEDKKTEFSYAMEAMFKVIIPEVKKLHGNDGLIFTCRGTAYQSGTDRHILKWKPPNENTIDFLMHVKWSTTDPHPDDPDQTPQDDYHSLPERFSLYIFHGQGNYSYVDDLYVTPEDWEAMKSKNYPLQDAIVECFVEDVPQTNGYHGTNSDDHNRRRWRYHRLREDKDEANHVSTYDSVKESIHDNVTEQVLLDRAEEVKRAWKKRNPTQS